MDMDTYSRLLEIVGPRITKQDTDMRRAITPGNRLALTLRYLAAGNLPFVVNLLIFNPVVHVKNIEFCEHYILN